jgi:nitroreductase
MDLKEAIYTRRSTRDHTTEPISEKIIRELIDAAIQAPTVVNAQPNSFCVVRDRSLLQTISRERICYGPRQSASCRIISAKY